MSRQQTPAKSKAGTLDQILLILAPPRSFCWKFCAALGHHPQLYALPEMHLFSARTVNEWWSMCDAATFTMSHGVLRAVAETIFGGQTEDTIKSANGWLRRRGHFTTAMVLEVLAKHVSPRVLVDKSPSIVYSLEAMNLAYRMFPRAKFIHLVRHPQAHCDSVLEAIKELKSAGPISEPHWLLQLARYPSLLPSELGKRDVHSDMQPQRGWYALNSNICTFLNSIPAEQQTRVLAEDFINSPDKTLRKIAKWLGLNTDSKSVEEMKHPERSPYAGPGPDNARFGNDSLYLNTPSLSASLPHSARSEEAANPHKSGNELHPEVIDLARKFGYKEG
jgi:hypothetical protein